MLRFSPLFAVLFFFSCSTTAQEPGYKIDVSVSGIDDEEAFFCYWMGDKPYIRDTVKVNEGHYIWEGTEDLDEGVYVFFMPSSKKWFDFVINKGEARFSLKTDTTNYVTHMEVTGSKSNKLLYDYLKHLGNERKKAEKISEGLKDLEKDSKEYKDKIKEREKVDAAVKDYQQSVIKKSKGKLPGVMIKASTEVIVPDTPADADSTWNYYYYKNHYWDNIDLTDGRMVRSQIYAQRLKRYINSVVVQNPDTLEKDIIALIEKTRANEEMFKYTLVTCLNKYARSKVVGMDKVYVAIGLKYYCSGIAEWTDQETMDKICENAKTLEPILVGKTAPDLTVQIKNGQKVKLHDVDSDYTLLLFWAPTCAHCKKELPILRDKYEELKRKGLTVFTLCNKSIKEVEKCWDYLDDNNMGDFINTIDPYYRSRFSKLYDVKTTPKSYLLDKDKKIISKNFGIKQLEEVLDKYIEYKEKQDKK